MTIRKKNKFKWALIITSFVLSIIMFATTVITFFVPEKNDHVLDRFDFMYGRTGDTIDEIKESRVCIVSKRHFKIDEIKIENNNPEVIVIIEGAYDGSGVSFVVGCGDDFEEQYEDNLQYFEYIDYVRIALKFRSVDGENIKLNMFNIGKLFDGVTIEAY